MNVGVMQVELAIDWAESLKDKRSVVRSLKDALHRHHQVSAAEVDDLDILNRASIGITMASNSGGHIGIVFDRVLNHIRSNPESQIVSCSREIMHGWVGHATDPETLQSDAHCDMSERAMKEMMIERGSALNDSMFNEQPLEEYVD